MPAKSKSSSASFKKGHIPWNKKGSIDIVCQNCSSHFKVSPCRKDTARYCSNKCAVHKWIEHKQRNSIKTQKCIDLANQKLTIAEISKITGYPPGSVSSYLNKAKYRKRTKAGESYTSVVKRLRKLYNKCSICNFDRIVEVAHIIPASKGGELSEENTLGLCPNHHHLFDNNKLTEEEFNKIKEKVYACKK